MARTPRPAARRADSTMEHLLDELEGETPDAEPARPAEGPALDGLRTAATVPPPPPDAGAEGAAAPTSAGPPPAQTPAEGAEGLVTQARELIAACESELTTDPDSRRAARLHYEIARLYESVLRDDRHASAHYQEALRRTPEHVPTLRGARRTYIARANPRAALPLFDAEARLTADPHRKATLYLAKGRLLEDTMGRKAEARDAYVTAFELDRTHPAVLKALEQSYFESADWEALDRVLERTANVFSEDTRHRAALVVQRAQILESRRGDVDGAIELYETALRLDPTASGALEALKRLHHQQRRFRDLIRVLEVESQHASDPRVRAMALYRIGRVHLERLGDRDEALAAFERATREAPEDLLVLEELVPLYEAAGRPDHVVGVLQALADATPVTEEKVALLHRMGAVRESELDEPEAAIDCYEAALRLSPDHVPTLQALARLYGAFERFEDLVRLYSHEGEHAEEAERRASAHVRAAELLEHRLERKGEAAEHHSRALSAVAGHPAAFKGLTRLLSEAHKWRELVELHERAVEQARRPDEAVGHLFKVGALYEDALGEQVQAAHVYERILRLDPHDMRAIHALQRTTERADRWPQYLAALEREVNELDDDGDKVPLLQRMGEVLHDRMGDWEGAVTRLREALGIDPNHTPTLGALGRLYHAAGRWEDLLEIYERELELAENDGKRIALLGRMAELCTERIGRDSTAIEYYKRILQIDPGHGQALRTVAHLLEERGDFESLLHVLQMESETVGDPGTRARIAFKMGELYEHHLEDPARALRAYEKALEGMPGHRPSLDALSRLRASQSSWKSLVEGLVHNASGNADSHLAVEALVEAGDLCAHRLGDYGRAITCYEQAREQAPSNVGVLVALEWLYRRVGDHERLAEIYRTQADSFIEEGAQLAALRELLRLQTHHGIGTEEESEQTCQAILERAGDDPVALSFLEAHALASGDRQRLVYVDSRLAASVEDPAERAAHHTRIGESLEMRGEMAALEAYRAALAEDPEDIAATRGLSRIAARMDDPEALAEAARREARVSHDGDTAADLLVRSANLRSDRLGDLEGAVSDLIRALELAPDHEEAAERLDKALTTRQAEARLADLLARAATSASTRKQRVKLWKRVAHLQAERLDNLTGAISSLNRVLRSAPDDIETVQRLADLYTRDGQWNEAVNLHHRILQLAPDSEALREAHLRLATLYDERMGEAERALVSLQAVLALDPGHEQALRKLAELHQREGRLAQARDVATRLVQGAEPGPSRAAALTLLATIARESGLGEQARTALREAVALEGPSGEAALELRSTANRSEHWQLYVDALWEHVQGSNEPQPEAYSEIARVLVESLGRPEAAIEALEAGLEQTGGEPVLRRELATRLQQTGRHERAIEQLQRLIEREPDGVAPWRALADIYTVLGQPFEARIATQPLVVLGAATPREAEHLTQTPPRPASASPRAVDGRALRRLTRLARGEQAAADLLSLLAPALGKLYPADLEAYGLTARDRIGPRSEHPLRPLVTKLAAILGDIELDLYVHRVRGRGAHVELGDSPALLVPATLLDAPLPQQVFLLARPMVHMARGFEAIDKLTPRELEAVVASATRSVHPGFGEGLTNEEFLNTQAKRIRKALPRRTRKAMQEVAGRYAQSPKVDFVTLCAAMRRTANRVAALISDDLVAVVEALRSTERELSDLSPAELVRASPVARDLVRFWGADEAMALRAQLGMG